MQPVLIDGPRMSDISELAETLYLKKLQEHLVSKTAPIIGVHLWTHSPKRLIENTILIDVLTRFRAQGVPLAFQITVTGLGGTIVEPGIETTEQAFFHLEQLLEQQILDPEKICIRIDPLQVWHYKGQAIRNIEKTHFILEHAARLGIGSL